MFTPIMDSMPLSSNSDPNPPFFPPSNSSDLNPPFYPPPHGATDGGQPGLFSAFPGARHNAQPSSSQWPPPHGTPYPSAPWPLSTPVISTPAWAPNPGYYPPAAGTPLYAPQPHPPPAAGWGQYTPATMPGTGYPPGPTTPYHPPTPYFTGQPPPPTPYEPVSFRATGWYDGPQSAGAVEGGGGYLVARKKVKRRGSRHRHDDDAYAADDGLWHSASMKRTHSQGMPKRHASLQRSASWGHAQGGGGYGYGGGGGVGYGGGGGYGGELLPPAYARGDVWDEHNLARRPRDWRADFTGREGLAGYLPQMLPAMLKPKTDVREWTDTERREIHPLLQYRPAAPPISYDLRHASAPFDPSLPSFPTLARPHNDIDLAQLASSPPAFFLRLVHPLLPWPVDVRAGHPNGITVYDVLRGLTGQLGTPIHGRHFWNEALGAAERGVVAQAFQERCRGRLELVPRGVLQVDFLGERCVFLGVVRGARGVWEVKTGKP
ncbi:hypothetical protein BJ912DRAFT_1034130 [Pholiota molesta]|nr:hypothetical protein BJ912DRAFT_1034130 [Pholiota molesta]